MRTPLLGLLIGVLVVSSVSVPLTSAQPSRRVLPRWQDQWSDGCSFAPDWSARVRQACVRHDERYYYGGSAEDRRRADHDFQGALVAAEMPRWVAVIYYAAVRLGGVPWGRIEQVSWAFGGSHFRYSDRPADPAD